MSQNLTGQRGIREFRRGAALDHFVELSAATRQFPVLEAVNLVTFQYRGSVHCRKYDPLLSKIDPWVLAQCNWIIVVVVQLSMIARPILNRNRLNSRFEIGRAHV